MRRLLVAVGAAALLALPGSAGATITASSVDTSNGPFFDGIDSGPGLVITGHVTSDATSTDKVKLACDGYGELKGPGNAGYSVGSDGSVSINVGHAMDFYYCLARIVPLAATPPYDAAFAPTPIGITDRDNYAFPSPDDQDYYDSYQSVSGPAGYADGDSLGDCALNSTYTINSDYSYAQLFKCSGVFDSDPSDSSKSMILLDGVNTLTPYHAYLSFPPDQVQRITGLQHDVNTQTGEVLVSGSEALATCPASCTAPSPAGAHGTTASMQTTEGGWSRSRTCGTTTGPIRSRSTSATSSRSRGPTGSSSCRAIPTSARPRTGRSPRLRPDPASFAHCTIPRRRTAPTRGARHHRVVHGARLGDRAGCRVRRRPALPPDHPGRWIAADLVRRGDHDRAGRRRSACRRCDRGDETVDRNHVTGRRCDHRARQRDREGHVVGRRRAAGGERERRRRDGGRRRDWSVDVPLPTDPTTLTATATDADGNTARATRTVHKAIPLVFPRSRRPSRTSRSSRPRTAR